MSLAHGYEVVWQPQRAQARAIRCPFDEILYGGSAGAGKSDALLGDWLQHAELHGKKAIGTLFRKTYKELGDLIRRSQELFAEIARWREDEKEWHFHDGPLLRLMYLDSYADALSHKGWRYTWAGWDELTQWATDEEYTYLFGRMGSPHDVQPRIFTTSNPDGPGHTWVKKRFGIDTNPNGIIPIENRFIDPDIGKEIVLRRVFIPGKLKDNRYLANDGRYYAALASDPNEVRRMMRLGGRWDVVEGAFFKNWDPAVHIVPEHQPPTDAKRWMGGDWGTGHPYCFLWFYQRGNGDVVVYRELYGQGPRPNVGTGETCSVVAGKIREIESRAGEWVVERYLDSSCWNNDGHDISQAELFALPPHAIHFIRAQKKNKPGAINALLEMMNVVNGHSRVIVTSNCKNLIRCIGGITGDPNDVNLYDTRAEDHAIDAFLYGIRRDDLTPQELRQNYEQADGYDYARSARVGSYGMH